MAWLNGGHTYSTYKAHQIGLVDEVILQPFAEEAGLVWLNKVMGWGEKNFAANQNVLEDEQGTFEALWLEEEHKKVLTRFK